MEENIQKQLELNSSHFDEDTYKQIESQYKILLAKFNDHVKENAKIASMSNTQLFKLTQKSIETRQDNINMSLNEVITILKGDIQTKDNIEKSLKLLHDSIYLLDSVIKSASVYKLSLHTYLYNYSIRIHLLLDKIQKKINGNNNLIDLQSKFDKELEYYNSIFCTNNNDLIGWIKKNHISYLDSTSIIPKNKMKKMTKKIKEYIGLESSEKVPSTNKNEYTISLTATIKILYRLNNYNTVALKEYFKIKDNDNLEDKLEEKLLEIDLQNYDKKNKDNMSTMISALSVKSNTTFDNFFTKLNETKGQIKLLSREEHGKKVLEITASDNSIKFFINPIEKMTRKSITRGVPNGKKKGGQKGGELKDTLDMNEFSQLFSNLKNHTDIYNILRKIYEKLPPVYRKNLIEEYTEMKASGNLQLNDVMNMIDNYLPYTKPINKSLMEVYEQRFKDMFGNYHNMYYTFKILIPLYIILTLLAYQSTIKKEIDVFKIDNYNSIDNIISNVKVCKKQYLDIYGSNYGVNINVMELTEDNIDIVLSSFLNDVISLTNLETTQDGLFTKADISEDTYEEVMVKYFNKTPYSLKGSLYEYNFYFIYIIEGPDFPSTEEQSKPVFLDIYKNKLIEGSKNLSYYNVLMDSLIEYNTIYKTIVDEEITDHIRLTRKDQGIGAVLQNADKHKYLFSLKLIEHLKKPNIKYEISNRLENFFKNKQLLYTVTKSISEVDPDTVKVLNTTIDIDSNFSKEENKILKDTTNYEINKINIRDSTEKIYLSNLIIFKEIDKLNMELEHIISEEKLPVNKILLNLSLFIIMSLIILMIVKKMTITQESYKNYVKVQKVYELYDYLTMSPEDFKKLIAQQGDKVKKDFDMYKILKEDLTESHQDLFKLKQEMDELFNINSKATYKTKMIELEALASRVFTLDKEIDEMYIDIIGTVFIIMFFVYFIYTTITLI